MNKQTDPTSTSRLIVKFLHDELSAEEQTEFDRWLSADPDNITLLESFRDTDAVQKEIDYIDTVDRNAGWAAVKGRIQSKATPKSVWVSWIRYAAAAVLILSAGIGLYHYTSSTPGTSQAAQSASNQDVMPGKSRAVLQLMDGTSLNLNGENLELDGKDRGKLPVDGELALKVPKAGEYKMTLPDGTKVWLNAASILRFPASFNKNERRVELEGEAYFEVSHNKHLPFVVSVNTAEIKVLGTHFNVESYGATCRATLLEGAVQISERQVNANADQQKVVLTPGQQALVKDGYMDVEEIDTQKSVAWKEGLFYFKEDRIIDILDKVARWYDVEIVYTSKPNNKRYDGTIRRQATLSQVLDMLNTVSGTEFSISERKVTVSFSD